jgi:lambda family phage portal protein
MGIAGNILSRLTGRSNKKARNEFDGSRQRRRLKSWQPTQTTINVILASQGHILRARCRDAMRNNPHANAASDSFVANLIGTGIKPSSLIADNPDLRQAIMDLWLEWTDQCDADGLADFYGMQTIVARSLFEAGECFIRFRNRRVEDGILVPLQIQLLESEMCPYGHNLKAPNGNFIMNGIELDFLGKRAAYWFYPVHPGDMPIEVAVNNLQPIRVPASEVLHIFRCTRPGQMRGVPLITPALVRLFFLDQYDDAELERKRIAAMFAGFITTPTPEDVVPIDGLDDSAPQENVGLSGLEPGTMQTLMPGEDIKFSEPADVGGSYEAYQYRQQLALFGALGIPYSLATSDLRRANYSSLRGSIVEYRRKLEQFQHNVIVYQMCAPIWRRWMDTAILAEALDINATMYLADKTQFQKAKWIPQRNDWVDPLKDRQAEKLAVDSGFKSRSDVIEAEGYDPEENDKRIAADHQREEALGLTFPTTKGGTTDADKQAEADQAALDAAQAAADEAAATDDQVA